MLDIAPDPVPPPCLANAAEDNTSTTAVMTMMKGVNQKVVDRSGYSINSGTPLYYTHQPYSTNNIQSNI